MLYKGDTLYLDWLEDGIAELVFDAPGSVNKLDTATVASLGQALDHRLLHSSTRILYAASFYAVVDCGRRIEARGGCGSGGGR